MKTFARQPWPVQIESFIEPCKGINQLDYRYMEVDFDDDKHG